MKKNFFLFALLIGISSMHLFTQTMGNYDYDKKKYNPYLGNTSYNTRSDDSGRDRSPVSNAIIYNNNEIQVVVNGLINVKANDFVATFNLVQIAETADSTNQMMSRKINLFKNELNKIGIGSSDMNADMISFVPRYDLQPEKKLFSKTYNEVPAGFEMQKNVTVHFKESDKLDEIMFVASKLEIYDLVKVDYYLTDVQIPLDTIRNKCLKEVKSKLKAYEMVGFKMDTMSKVMADDFKVVTPPTRYYSYSAFCRPSLHAAKKKEPSVTEVPKVVSQYYSGVDYDKYDIVINPTVIEPMVQVSYTITLRYFLQQENVNGKYLIVNSNGEMRQLGVN